MAHLMASPASLWVSTWWRWRQVHASRLVLLAISLALMVVSHGLVLGLFLLTAGLIGLLYRLVLLLVRGRWRLAPLIGSSFIPPVRSAPPLSPYIP